MDDNEVVAMQIRCIHCGREQDALRVHAISHGHEHCAWCHKTSTPMTLNEYRDAIRRVRTKEKPQ